MWEHRCIRSRAVCLGTALLGLVVGMMWDLVDLAALLENHNSLIPLFLQIRLGKTELSNPTRLGRNIIWIRALNWGRICFKKSMSTMWSTWELRLQWRPMLLWFSRLLKQQSKFCLQQPRNQCHLKQQENPTGWFLLNPNPSLLSPNNQLAEVSLH